MANEFLQARVAKADFTILASAATQSIPSGVYIPKGAYITGVTIMDVDALGSVHSNDSATIDLRLAGGGSSVQVLSTKVISVMADASKPYVAVMLSTNGVYVPQNAELVLSVQASSGTLARTFSPTMYVGYIA
ncbi:MAG: hypothetical protein IMZ64_03630 [Bacteroidetes bacterium]|nr:hypothetical protein [Bacteroidota bacterium]